MKILFFICCVITGSTIFAQQNKVAGVSQPEVRVLNAPFSAINITDGIELILTQGDEEHISVSYSDEKYAERFKTIVEDGVLNIYFDNNGINWSDNSRRKLKAYVSFKTIDKLTAAGGAKVTVANAANLNNLFLKFTSGATFNGKLRANEISTEQNSASMINISGSANKLHIDVNSAAGFKGYGFAVENCEAKAGSGGFIRVSVQKELSARANSGGGIYYKGAALIKDININSGGIVKKV